VSHHTWLQAFYLAKSGRPGPVLVDVPKDVQQQLAVPDFDQPMAIDGYISRLPQEPEPEQVAAVIAALREVRGFRGIIMHCTIIMHCASHCASRNTVSCGMRCLLYFWGASSKACRLAAAPAQAVAASTCLTTNLSTCSVVSAVMPPHQPGGQSERW